MISTEPRASWTKRYNSWLPFTRECEWCGDDFTYYAPPAHMDHLRYCSRSCVNQAKWEGRRCRLPSREILIEMYILRNMSQPAIARKFGCSPGRISEKLAKHGILARVHTSTHACRICGNEVRKQFHSKRDVDGSRILAGTLCSAHLRERWRREYQRRVTKNKGELKWSGQEKTLILQQNISRLK